MKDPGALAKFNQLDQFLETCSDTSLGDLLLSKMNGSANSAKEFQQHIQKLLNATLNLVEFAENWAQSEAEQRYVAYVREAGRQRREMIELTGNESALSVTRSKQ